MNLTFYKNVGGGKFDPTLWFKKKKDYAALLNFYLGTIQTNVTAWFESVI